MTLFALLWALLFLVAIVPVMRYEKKLRTRRALRRLAACFDVLAAAYGDLGKAATYAGASIQSYGRAIDVHKTDGSPCWCDPIIETY